MGKVERARFLSEGLKLEARLMVAEGASLPAPGAIVAHPHPLFGGSMDNNVVYALEEALADRGFVSLCFNFRGVGKSQGKAGDLMGSAEDIVSAFSYLSQKSDVKKEEIHLLGYSFGGLACLYALSKIKPKSAILISPMVPDEGFKEVVFSKKAYEIPMLIILGDKDQFYKLNDYEFLINNFKARLELIKGADHFFLAKEKELKDKVISFLSSL